MSSSNYSSSFSSSEQKKLSREEIQHRISKLKAKLEKIEKRARKHETSDADQAKQHVPQKAYETVEQQFHTIMDKFNVRGFVYSYQHENGTIVTGASDSLKDWWKDEVHSYQDQNQEGIVMGTSSIDSNDSSENDQILPDHSNTGNLRSNDMAPASEDYEKDGSP
ncbi:Protein ETHYLENE INSENSITIVE 3 [Carex littledalei]|uniref:Protein ETHYLENE INSENSITIVE 3 n=1 Tax=Carex littledalei TaxID=544730 RepID=A0A833VT47_9POAL|nr:Protein ETHYLENE INSENSITIVE 3 [Carex littledalei]